MALKWETKYPGNTNAGDTDYPQGSARNDTSEGAKDGFPQERSWINDFAGFFQGLLKRAGISPSENPDTVDVSDYQDALFDSELFGNGAISGVSLDKLEDGVANVADVSSNGLILSPAKLYMVKISTSGSSEMTPLKLRQAAVLGATYGLEVTIEGGAIKFGASTGGTSPGADVTVCEAEFDVDVSSLTTSTSGDVSIVTPALELVGIPYGSKIHSVDLRTSSGALAGVGAAFTLANLDGVTQINLLRFLTGTGIASGSTGVKLLVRYDPTLVD